MASMYSAKVMEHFANPHNVGELPDANGVGEVGNPKCGDIMRMYLKIENNVIVDVKFLTFGCGAAIATSSMATDLIKGKTVDEALKLTNKAVVEALEGLPPVKVHCSVLAEQAVKAALSDYYRRQGIDPEPIVGKLEEDCEHWNPSWASWKRIASTARAAATDPDSIISKKEDTASCGVLFASPLVRKGVQKRPQAFLNPKKPNRFPCLTPRRGGAARRQSPAAKRPCGDPAADPCCT